MPEESLALKDCMYNYLIPKVVIVFIRIVIIGKKENPLVANFYSTKNC